MTYIGPQIAVVAMGGIFPGAGTPAGFIDNILGRKEAIIQVPRHRWPAPSGVMVCSPPVPDRAASDRAGLITDFDFDPQGFALEPGFLAELDPVHHLVLSAGRQAMAACPLTPKEREQTGVILAAIALPTKNSSELSRQMLCADRPMALSPAQAMGSSVVSTPAALLARAFGLYGGSFTLDAACASSLYAIKLACEHLILKKADVMVAGGVSRPDALYTQVGFTQLQAISPTGRCAPFDRDADGLVVGEGTGLVVLKRLEDALAAQNDILGVIRGWGVSNDIEGNLVAPASEGQVRAMSAAYEMAGWSLADIQYMECHGSGTVKGDQVEVASIHTLARQSAARSGRGLAIGSVKSNIGHLLTAAGAAGFIKTLLAMQRRTLPPSLNFTAPPDNSPMKAGAIRVETLGRPWEPARTGSARRAGVSAFGFGGINAHLLIEEFCPQTSRHFVPGPAKKPAPAALVPVAIVGLAAVSGSAGNIDDFETMVLGNTGPSPGPAAKRWRHTNHLPEDIKKSVALYMDGLDLEVGEFCIPPNQMEDILPQHLVMLRAARSALADAGTRPRPDKNAPPRHTLGCAVGIEFDFGATDYFLRWAYHDQSPQTLAHLSPALTFDRTLGALGGIVASRIAREFKVGGPCFTLSAGSASGLKAVETGMLSLSSNETDLYLCGCVDMAGDVREFTVSQAVDPESLAAQSGILPSEGACALVLKRLDQAQKDNDRIYAVIRGSGGSGGRQLPAEAVGQEKTPDLAQTFQASLDRAAATAGIRACDLNQVYVHNQGIRSRAESLALEKMGPLPGDAVRHPARVIGDTGAAAGLFDLVWASLALFHQSAGTPERQAMAAVGGLTLDGAAAHLILEAPRTRQESPRVQITDKPRAAKATGCIRISTTRPPVPDEVLKKLGAGSGSPTPKPLARSPLGLEAPILEAPSPALVKGLAATQKITARAHEKFLDLSGQNLALIGQQFNALVQNLGQNPDQNPNQNLDQGLDQGPAVDRCQARSQEPDPPAKPLRHAQNQTPAQASPAPARIFLDRDQCLEYARGKAGNVLGPEFDIIDTYPVRVRLPDEPLMLVDRIVSIHGKMLSLGPGKIVTQHDVLAGAWYLDGGKAPVSISIEAGQADLFLCAWLGIDHKVKGSRKYRLLDAKVTFHRPLPVPGETIEYHIEIDRFLKQGEIYLFFFHYQGLINGQPFISMRDGCAGFFTEAEVENSGGIILKKEDCQISLPPAPSVPGAVQTTPGQMAPMAFEALSDTQVDALRQGDLETAFGPAFAGVGLGRNQWLPQGRMTLIHRVLALEPRGGRFGLGRILAEADIHPDDWFLTCHFIDDMVMPGTLMYECCTHALRIFVQRMGWVSPDPDVHYDVLAFNESDLKCRGPVTRQTKKARYEIEIKELGYGPEPFVRADAHMFSDELRIVYYKDMGMKLAGVTGQALMAFWRK